MQETERALVAYVDSRIQQLDANVDTRINRLDANIQQRLDKQDEVALRQDAKLDLLLEFRPATEVRLKALEEEVNQLRQRPLKSWQVVTGVASIAICLLSTVVSIIFDVITLAKR